MDVRTQADKVDVCLVIDDFAIKIVSTEVDIEREVWIEEGDAVVLRRCPTSELEDVESFQLVLNAGVLQDGVKMEWRTLPNWQGVGRHG